MKNRPSIRPGSRFEPEAGVKLHPGVAGPGQRRGEPPHGVTRAKVTTWSSAARMPIHSPTWWS
jgi:hypothetical protein